MLRKQRDALFFRAQLLNVFINVFAGIFMTRVAGRTTLYKQMFESYENMFGEKFLPVSIRNCIAVSESNTTFEPLLTYDKRCTAAQDYIELVNYLGLMDNTCRIF